MYLLRRVLNAPKWSGNKIKCSKILPSGGCRYHTRDAEFWLPDPNVQKVIKILYFGHAGDEGKKGSVCNVTDVSSWKHVNFKAYYAGRYGKHCGLREYSENLLDQFYKHYVQRKPHSPEKICLHQLTPVPTKKAKDERNILSQSTYTKPKTRNLTNSHLQDNYFQVFSFQLLIMLCSRGRIFHVLKSSLKVRSSFPSCL